MAYLNCPFCPSQGVPTKVQDLQGYGLAQFQCFLKHTFFVRSEDITGDYKTDAEELQ